MHARGGGVDSSYDVQIIVSVRRGIILSISIHSIHKIEVLIFSSVYTFLINKFEVKVEIQKGPKV